MISNNNNNNNNRTTTTYPLFVKVIADSLYQRWYMFVDIIDFTEKYGSKYTKSSDRTSTISNIKEITFYCYQCTM